MILLYGQQGDGPLEHVLTAVRETGSRYVFVEQNALHLTGLAFGEDHQCKDAELTVAGARVPLGDVTSVYARPLEPCLMHLSSLQAERIRWMHQHLMDWLDTCDACVVNRPRAMQSNASKPLQAQIIGATGFRVPPTLVTNDVAQVRDFIREHKRVIYKSTSGIRSIVREFDDAAEARLGLLAALPVQFQAYISGVDIRVHVVGSRVFATEVRSTAIDYRYAARERDEQVEMVETRLSDSVSARCVELTGRLGLWLSGVDLRRTPDGEYVCFEANPMPAYSYFQDGAGQPIAEAIAQLLATTPARQREVSHGECR